MEDRAIRLRVLVAAFEGVPLTDLSQAIMTRIDETLTRVEPWVPPDRIAPILREAIDRGEVRIVDVMNPDLLLSGMRVDELLNSLALVADDESAALELTDLGHERLDSLLAEVRAEES